MSKDIPAIFEFPGVSILPSKLEAGVIKMVRRVRPDWRKEDIILQGFSCPEGIGQNIALGNDCTDIVYGGYTTEKSETVMIKIFKANAKDQFINKNEEVPYQVSKLPKL